MKISIIGSGFVGTATGRGLIELGSEVIFYDVVDKDLPNFTFTIPEGIDLSCIKAFGGKCLPKDLKAFVSFAERYHKPRLLKSVDEINEEMKNRYGVRE